MNDALFISVKHEPFRLTLNALSLNATLIDHFCTTRILGGIIGIFQMLWSFRKHLSKKKGRSLSKMRYSRKKSLRGTRHGCRSAFWKVLRTLGFFRSSFCLQCCFPKRDSRNREKSYVLFVTRLRLLS